MSTFLWILTGVLATGLFIYAKALPNPPSEKKE
jgi:hypothetical protein